MRIVHVVPFGLDPYSGVYAAVAGLTGALAQAGHAVEAWNLSSWPTERAELAAELDAAGVVRRELPSNGKSWSLTPEAKKMIDQDLAADVVHLHSAFSPQNNLIARRIDLPVVLSPHGVLQPGSMGKSPIRKQMYRRLVELPTLRKVAAVCALSKAEATEVRDFGYQGRIEVLPNGVPEPTVGADPTALKQSLGIAGNARIGLYVGRIQIDHKRLDVVAEAVSEVAGWHLVVVGSDYRGDAARLQLLVAELPGADRIHLVGPKQGEELAQAYAGSDVFLLLSRSEGMSMALLEALSYSLPAIVSPEVEDALPVSKSGGGWTAVGDTLPDVLGRIGELAEDGWENCREAARALVSEYTWEAIAAGYVDLYESLGAPLR